MCVLIKAIWDIGCSPRCISGAGSKEQKVSEIMNSKGMCTPTNRGRGWRKSLRPFQFPFGSMHFLASYEFKNTLCTQIYLRARCCAKAGEKECSSVSASQFLRQPFLHQKLLYTYFLMTFSGSTFCKRRTYWTFSSPLPFPFISGYAQKLTSPMSSQDPQDTIPTNFPVLV